jgi:CheY-like chemotaxis protein
VATTVLAVDDSVTMRKVLEITFAGSDYHVVTAAGGDAALQAVQQHRPAIALVDATLEPSDGYEVCRQIKAASPSTAVVILSSKQNPYNTGSGSAAGADDHIDKPYDTQQVLDKVGRVLSGGAQPAAAAPAPAARPAPAAAAAPAARPAAAPANIPSSGAPRAKTLLYSPDAVPPALAAARAGQPAPAAAPAARPAAPAPAAHAAHAPAAAAAVGPAISAAVNGQLQQKLGDLALTPAQIDAVAALSREIVERVVWEVVPVLAETIIKEEIARLTR